MFCASLRRFAGMKVTGGSAVVDIVWLFGLLDVLVVVADG